MARSKKTKNYEQTFMNLDETLSVNKNYLFGRIGIERIEGKFQDEDNPLYNELPDYIISNLKFPVRYYQRQAIQNLLYYERYIQKNEQTHLLFHMATGSGKTYIMAALMLHYYKQGYRNFMFFVNDTSIIAKTKINFMDESSEKYLFKEFIKINAKNITINEVNTFSNCDDNSINIHFTTISKLQSDVDRVQENRISKSDFNEKVIFIADESHHLNASLSSSQKKIERTWGELIGDLLRRNKDSKLFEFTATCDLTDEKINNKYKDKIIYNFRLQEFRNAGYTKDYNNFQTGLPVLEKILVAVLFSYYREKIFIKNKIRCKPSILIKSKTKEENERLFLDYKFYVNYVLDESIIKKILNMKDYELIREITIFLDSQGITIQNLIEEIKISFNGIHLLKFDGNNKTEESIKLANKLDDNTNPIRMVFIVDMLKEGWDVINLFDIVRAYDVANSSATTSEAQLIGRGVRYFPFPYINKYGEEYEKYKRKFDNDSKNELKICETFYFHSTNNSKYIESLKNELREQGFDINDNSYDYILKESFKKTKFYNEGQIYVNKRIKQNNSIKDYIPNDYIEYTTVYSSGQIYKDVSLSEEKINAFVNHTNEFCITIKLKDYAKENYHVIFKILRLHDVFRFDSLRKIFPKLNNLKDFVLDEQYAGKFQLQLYTDEPPTAIDFYNGFTILLSRIASKLEKGNYNYYGTKEYYPILLKENIGDKTRYKNISNMSYGEGIPQSEQTLPTNLYLQVKEKPWFVYEEHYGTDEEKYFIKFFDRKYLQLCEMYDEVYLIRNEREVPVYTIKQGLRFEPDFFLFLICKKTKKSICKQIFLEPKGKHISLSLDNQEKEQYLKEIKDNYLLNYDNHCLEQEVYYDLAGLPFYSHDKEIEFERVFDEYLELK